MSALTSILNALSPPQRIQCYQDFAATALACYGVAHGAPAFLQHNSGITYRVPTHDPDHSFLLKIHDSIGEGTAEPAAHIHARMHWLADVGQVTPLTIQMPVLNRDGTFVSNVAFPGVAHPVPCTLQCWVGGEHPSGDFTLSQIEAVGAMMAQVHMYSATWEAADGRSLPTYDTDDVCRAVAQLRTAVTLGIISADQYDRLEQTSQVIRGLAERLGRGPAVWGPIHGDLHHGNLLFEGTTVHPIDFDGLHTTYYLLDLATTLYHILHQDIAIRAALISSYRQQQRWPTTAEGTLEAFVTWAAIDNLAFQITIPEQRISPLFARNMRQLVNDFCPKVLRGVPFVCV